MSGNYIDIKKLNIDELAGVVTLYPWYGAARKELCRRMMQVGGDSWGQEHFSEAAMYVGTRGIIADLFMRGEKADCSDKDVETLLSAYIKRPDSVPEERLVRVVGGDYFSQAQYEDVRKDSDNVFSRFAAKARTESPENAIEGDLGDDFCTEPLARIYEEQGYYEQAKHIYSRLLLKFPEKSAYFASLIEKLVQN